MLTDLPGSGLQNFRSWQRHWYWLEIYIWELEKVGDEHGRTIFKNEWT